MRDVNVDGRNLIMTMNQELIISFPEGRKAYGFRYFYKVQDIEIKKI